MEKPLEVPNSEPKINELGFEPEINELGVEPDPEITKIGFFEPITEDPMYNWIWTDIDDNDYEYNEDDLRDPDMTTVSGTGSDFSGTGNDLKSSENPLFLADLRNVGKSTESAETLTSTQIPFFLPELGEGYFLTG